MVRGWRHGPERRSGSEIEERGPAFVAQSHAGLGASGGTLGPTPRRCRGGETSRAPANRAGEMTPWSH
ncbi:MAG: hypothetical protein AVDCRST_MAG59-3423 [uncultured Thermomicrobiales bacterium]|uniref:Uncharacterized protein n=1 Tax=uncultured Thermomicrobiales bacterium TaxID=1645740 RepID=A0A6J4V5E9_9BACT|nr:MAG: hypothetical protein AVDCRST_MAG59-3423 [uncultured Thermomicrobiales bacterium]